MSAEAGLEGNNVGSNGNDSDNLEEEQNSVIVKNIEDWEDLDFQFDSYIFIITKLFYISYITCNIFDLAIY